MLQSPLNFAFYCDWLKWRLFWLWDHLIEWLFCIHHTDGVSDIVSLTHSHSARNHTLQVFLTPSCSPGNHTLQVWLITGTHQGAILCRFCWLTATRVWSWRCLRKRSRKGKSSKCTSQSHSQTSQGKQIYKQEEEKILNKIDSQHSEKVKKKKGSKLGNNNHHLQ